MAERYFLCLARSDFRVVRLTLARTNRLHRIRSSLFANFSTPLAPVDPLLPVPLIKRLAPISCSGRDRTKSARERRQPDSGWVYWTCVPIHPNWSSALHPFQVPVVIGLNPPASEDNPTQVECIGHVCCSKSGYGLFHFIVSSGVEFWGPLSYTMNVMTPTPGTITQDHVSRVYVKIEH